MVISHRTVISFQIAISLVLDISFENTISLVLEISHEMFISFECCFEKFIQSVNLNFCGIFQASNVQFDPLHNICCVYDEKLPKMVMFKEILEFMKRLPIQKALTNQHLVFRSHIERFWENAKYDEESKMINLIVSLNGQDKDIVIIEQLVREVLDVPDDEDSLTKFSERMVKGCML
ncbi:hypothetical protein Hanom_Chr12g01149061 [Helianthus anomalus]